MYLKNTSIIKSVGTDKIHVAFIFKKPDGKNSTSDLLGIGIHV